MLPYNPAGLCWHTFCLKFQFDVTEGSETSAMLEVTPPARCSGVPSTWMFNKVPVIESSRSGCRSKHASCVNRPIKNYSNEPFKNVNKTKVWTKPPPGPYELHVAGTHMPRFFSFSYIPILYSASCLMSFWWWTWNNVQITGGWNIRRIQMKTPLCLLRLSLFAPSFAAAPQKLDFDGAQIKDELINWSTFIPNKLWQVSPPPQSSPPATGSTNIALLCRITMFLQQKLFREWNL